MASARGSQPTENVLYAFARGKIAIIEPESATIVKEITKGLEGSEWADVVVTADNRRIFASDRPNSLIHVFDAEKQEIIKTIKVGANPVHMYNPHQGDEIWSHADGEGAYYVIDINTLETIARVDSALNNAGHSKFRFHEIFQHKKR